MKLDTFLTPRFRYLGESDGRMQLGVMHACYWITIANMENAKCASKPAKPVAEDLKANDLVFLRPYG